MNSPRCRRLALAILIGSAFGNAHAASFVYEGRLDDLGQPANGRYDLKLSAYGHAAQGATLAAPLTFGGVEVKEGRFRLDVDLPLVQADQVWLEVAVRGSGEPAFSVIPGRAKAIAAPLIGACWSSTGDSGVNPATNFIGTTDVQPFVVRTGNAPSLRIEPSTFLFAGNPITTNTIAGSSANAVSAGVRGATIGGGGVPSGLSDPDFGNENPNRVGDHYGTVGGGYANRAGDDAGATSDRPFATVGGGAINTASGDASTVGGGFFNAASAFASTVSGGSLNCAGGTWSWAGGRRAKVRPGIDPNDFGSCSGLGVYPGGSGDEGTFVWADNQNANFVSTGVNQFLVRASGGMGINTNKLGATADFRSTELLIRNGVLGDNADLTLISNNNRGYNLALIPTAGGANEGSFVISAVDARTASDSYVARLTIASSGELSISANAFKPGGGSWANSSDAHLKEDISSLNGSLDRLLALHGVSFHYRADAPKALSAPGPQIGFVAQQVEQVFPQWVGEKDGFKTVAISGFEALTVEALRELRGESAVIDSSQSARLEQLEQENAALRAGQERLAAELAELRALVRGDAVER